MRKDDCRYAIITSNHQAQSTKKEEENNVVFLAILTLLFPFFFSKRACHKVFSRGDNIISPRYFSQYHNSKSKQVTIKKQASKKQASKQVSARKRRSYTCIVFSLVVLTLPSTVRRKQLLLPIYR